MFSIKTRKPTLLLLIAAFMLTAAAHAQPEGSSMNIRFETDYLVYAISPDGRSIQFEDKATGIDYCVHDPNRPFAVVWKKGERFDASSAAFQDGKLTVGFGDSGVEVVMAVDTQKHYVTFEVVSVSGLDIESLAIIDANLTLSGESDEPFAACVLALNLQTRVKAIPGTMNHLLAECYPRFGFKGAKVAVIGCPTGELWHVMQEVVKAAPDLPHSSLGGPWALDAKVNRGSYLFNFGNLTEKTVDDWIKLAKNLGITQIDFHGGSSFRFGDCRPNPEMYPEGRKSLKRVIDKLHEAGILAGLHPYSFFIDKSCPWVTPVPDPRLGKDATFTLAEDLDEKAAVVPVVETTENMSAITGFFMRNSVTVQVDDELIIYAGVSKEPPYAFTECQRGAHGTKVSPHKKGAKAHHLKQCYMLFAPDGDSTLLQDVAKAIADCYNECGFDMIYLDALDAGDVLGGAENYWHYESKFVFEIVKRLNKTPLMEMSAFHTHLWYVRSRMGAWDHPNRSHKLFINLHCNANKRNDAMFLPSHLGWWKIIADSDPRVEPTFSDDIEYLCGKCIGTECGLSPQGFTPEEWEKSYNLRRLGDIIRRYETLRLSNYFSDSVKKKLRESGAEFTLVEDESGKPRLKTANYAKHKVENAETGAWSVVNPFARQPLRLRIEALYSAGSYDAADNIVMADFSDASEFGVPESSHGATIDLTVLPGKDTWKDKNDTIPPGVPTWRDTKDKNDTIPPGVPTWRNTEAVKSGAVLTASLGPDRGVGIPWSVHGNSYPDLGARCARVGKVFSPTLDMSKHRAMGVWVYGDGKGEVINFRIKNPEHMMAGNADHYVIVDFEGPRYFELIEPESDRINDYVWPWSNIYPPYRELVEPSAIEGLNIWVNNLPEGKTVKCYLSSVKALPLVKTKLVNPSITVGGKTVTFPVELETGCYIEYNSFSDCKLYNDKGDLIGDIKPKGEAPNLTSGPNEIIFDCKIDNAVTPRARITVISTGDYIE